MSTDAAHERIEIDTTSAHETRELGRRLGRQLEPGDVVALIGELAAGKTVLTQGIAEGMEVPPHVLVSSPTFTLINRYRGRAVLIHADLYRITAAHELGTLGYEEWLDPADAVTVVEWADRAEEFLPRDHVRVTLEHRGADRRHIRVEPVGAAAAARWQDKLPHLCTEPDDVRASGTSSNSC